MAEHFHLKKMAPPYRLLARAMDYYKEESEPSMFSTAWQSAFGAVSQARLAQHL